MRATKLNHRPMTKTEIRNYRKNCKRAAEIRKAVYAFLKKKFGIVDRPYVLLFTEARAGGRCRTKMWLVRGQVHIPIVKFINRKYPDVKCDLVTSSPYNWGNSVSITVG